MDAFPERSPLPNASTRSVKEATNVRVVRVVTIVVTLLVLAACRLPTVADETVETLEGPSVTAVSQKSKPNPSDQWNYTYVMLEVTGPGSRLEQVSKVLRENGWEIRASSLPLLAYFTEPGEEKPETELVLADLDDVLDTHRSDEVGERFSEVPTHDDRTYYVAILTPLI